MGTVPSVSRQKWFCVNFSGTVPVLFKSVSFGSTHCHSFGTIFAVQKRYQKSVPHFTRTAKSYFFFYTSTLVHNLSTKNTVADTEKMVPQGPTWGGQSSTYLTATISLLFAATSSISLSGYVMSLATHSRTFSDISLTSSATLFMMATTSKYSRKCCFRLLV